MTVQTEISLRSISSTGLFKATDQQAWTEGTNIRTALRLKPEETRLAVIKMISKVSDFVDAKKRLLTLDDYALCAETIFDVFVTLKLEEFRLICDRMMTGHYGKFYERLKVSEFRECIIKHESARAEIIENQHKIVTRGAADPTNVPEYDAEAAKLAWRLKNNPFLIPNKNGASEDEE